MMPPEPTESEYEIRRLRDALDYHRARCRGIQAELDKHRVKCPGCRCRLLPGEPCDCCVSTAISAAIDDASPPSGTESNKKGT